MTLLILLPLLSAGQLPVGSDSRDGHAHVRARLLWAWPVIRTDSREYDAGVFSGTLNLHDDAGIADRALAGGLELELGDWRLSLVAMRLEADRTLDEPLAFEERQFPAGSSLHTIFEAGWVDVVYRLDLEVDPANRADLRILIGISATTFSFAFEGDGMESHEGHPALWPVPVLGGEGRLVLGDSLAVTGRLLVSRVKYVNPFHHDGGSPTRIVFDLSRAEIGFAYDLGRGWTLGAGLHRFTHYLRDTSREDRHRVWFDSGALAFEAAVAF
jgi:hypothetical protein